MQEKIVVLKKLDYIVYTHIHMNIPPGKDTT